jgi:hypothetical protein
MKRQDSHLSPDLISRFVNGPAQWHALLVRRRFERIVELYLKKGRVEHYLPIVRLEWRADVGIQFTEFPLFPGYVFCKCNSPSCDLTIPGVLAMERGTNDIQAVSEREITDLRHLLAAGLGIKPSPFLSQGRTAMIEEGPLSGVTGILEENKRMFVVSIQLIRQSIAVAFDALPRMSFRAGAVSPRRVAHVAS